MNKLPSPMLHHVQVQCTVLYHTESYTHKHLNRKDGVKKLAHSPPEQQGGLALPCAKSSQTPPM